MLDRSRGNPNDRSRSALVTLENRLRDVVSPALRSLLGPGWTHPIAPVVEEFSRERSLKRLACSPRPLLSQISPQALLDLLPHVLSHDRRMLAFVRLALMADPADINRIRQDLVDMPPAERATTGRAARAVDADRKPKTLSLEPLL